MILASHILLANAANVPASKNVFKDAQWPRNTCDSMWATSAHLVPSSAASNKINVSQCYSYNDKKLGSNQPSL